MTPSVPCAVCGKFHQPTFRHCRVCGTASAFVDPAGQCRDCARVERQDKATAPGEVKLYRVPDVPYRYAAVVTLPSGEVAYLGDVWLEEPHAVWCWGPDIYTESEPTRRDAVDALCQALEVR